MSCRKQCYIENPVKRHKTAILLVICIPVLLLLFLILYGVNRTPRCYAPTVSALLSDDITLTIAYAFIVLIYTVLEYFVAIEYVSHPPNTRHQKDVLLCGFVEISAKGSSINSSGYWARVFMVLRNAMFNLIAVIRFDEYSIPHYIVASLCVGFNQLMFAFQIFRRWSTEGKYIWIQVTHWIATVVVCLVFAIPAYFNPTWSNNNDWAIWEYLLFYLIASTNIYFVFDVENCCKENTKNCRKYSYSDDEDQSILSQS